ncbi:MAG: metallophosphoesterase family protein [Flavisolibacter sp.]
MKILAISDTHGRHHNIRLPKADVLIHAGDISYHGKKEEVINFLQWFSKQKAEYKIFIAGNHDFYLEHAKPEQLEALIPEGVIYLKDSGINIDEIKIWGSPVTPWFYNWAFNRHRGEEIRKHWDLIPANTNLLITHGPVYGFLDMVINEQHVGCQDLLRTVLTVQPKVHVCGHIHESYGSIKRSGIRFINASVVNEQYELANKPIFFDI